YRNTISITARVFLVAVILASFATGCGGGNGSDTTTTGGGGSTTTTTAAPSAPVLNVTFGLKQIQFSWSAISGATFYRLLQSPDGVAALTQVGGDMTGTGTTMDVAVHRINWAGVRFALDACNSAGCTRSSQISTANGQTQAVGYFKASNTGSGDGFSGPG